MAGSLRDISLRHLPDLSDASFSFSFQIPTEATVADDLLRADGGDDFLHAAAGDDSRVDEHELVPAATSSPPKLLPTTRSNIASSRVPKPVSAKAKGALLENDDNDATRTISAPVKSTVTEGPRAKVLDEGARVEDKPRTRASKPAPIMKHTRSNSAVSATSTNPPSKSKPKSTTSKPAIPAPAPPSDGGMAARLLMYGSGMHVDIDTTMDDAQGPRHLPPNDRDEDLADALREAAEEPIFSYAGEKDHPKSRPISPPTQSVPAVGRDERPVESASVQQSSDAHPPSVSAEAPLTLSQLSPQKDKPTASTTELDPGLSAPPAKPSTRAGSQDKSKKEKPASKVDSNVKRGVVKPKLKSTVDDSAKRVQVIPERTTADVDQEQEGGAPVSDVAEHEEVVDVDVAAVVPSASAVAPNVDAHEQLDELKPAENEEVQDDGGPLTVSQLSPRKQLEAQPDDGFMKRDRAPVRAPAPAKAARNATNVEKGKKPAQPVSKRDVQLKATPALPVSEMEETKPKMEENVEAELDSVEGARSESGGSWMDRREDVVQADTPNDDEDKDRPLTVSQLSPRKVQSGPETKPDEAEGEAEAAVRAPSPMRPAAKHPRPASVASHTGTGAIKKSRVDVSGAARGPSAARGRGRARVVSAPPRQAAPVGVRKTVTGVRKVSQPTISSSRWSRTTTSTRSQGDSGSGSKAPVASSSSGSKHTVINATATVPGEDAPTDGSKSKGYTIPDFKAMHASLALRRSQAAAPLVTPTPFSFSTDMRVKERHAFDAQVKVREEEKERERERERREREATEEDEVREMRRRAVPKAHEVPEWYKEAPKRAREA